MEKRVIKIGEREYIFSNHYSNGIGSFYHISSLAIDGKHKIKATCQYFNRTWEAYTYQTCMKKCIRDMMKLKKNESLLDELNLVLVELEKER